MGYSFGSVEQIKDVEKYEKEKNTNFANYNPFFINYDDDYDNYGQKTGQNYDTNPFFGGNWYGKNLPSKNYYAYNEYNNRENNNDYNYYPIQDKKMREPQSVPFGFNSREDPFVNQV